MLVRHGVARPGGDDPLPLLDLIERVYEDANDGFPPSALRCSLPAAHRAVLLWLFQDVVLWLIATDQIKSFRPRRN